MVGLFLESEKKTNKVNLFRVSRRLLKKQSVIISQYCIALMLYLNMLHAG